MANDFDGLPPLPQGFEPIDPGLPSIGQVPQVTLPDLTASPALETPKAPKSPSARRFAPEIDDVLDNVATTHGVDRNLLAAFAAIESSGNPTTKTGSYKGLFQLSDDEFAKHGGQGDIFDPSANANAAALKLKAESADFARRYGRAPTAAEIYLIHQQGIGGADAHWKNPDAPAWQNMASTAEGRQKGANWAKRAIWGNVPTDVRRQFGDVNNITSRDFVNLWETKVARFGGGETRMSLGGPKPDEAPLPDGFTDVSAGDLPPLPKGFTPVEAPAAANLPPLPKGFTAVDEPKAGDKPAGQTFSQAFGRGVDQMQGMLYGGVEALGEATGSKAITDFGREGRARNEDEAKAYGPNAEFLKIKGAGDFGQWAKETIGSQIPIMGPMLGGAVAGTIVGGPIGGVIGAFVPGFVMSTGEVQSNIKEKDPNAVVPSAAFVGGAAIAALDSILPGRIGSALVRRFGVEAAEEIAKRTLVKPVTQSMLVKGAKGAATGMATEGVTEALQEAIGDVAAAYGTGKPLDPNLGSKMLEAGAAGALLGGIMGPMGGPVQVSPGDNEKLPVPPSAAPQAPPEQPNTASSGSVPPPVPQAAPEEAGVLSQMGWSPQDIAGMGRAEIDAELADAAARGLVVPKKSPDAPSAEPIADLSAQIADMRSGARQAVYLSSDNVGNIESNPEFVSAISEALKGTNIVENIDGKGGVLATKDKATADAARAAISVGVSPDAVIGLFTGSGAGKAANADTVVQQRTPEGAVTRETLVPASEAPAAAASMAAPGRTVETLPAQEALARRDEQIAAEKGAITFKTAKGSTYTVQPDGTTIRDKKARPEHPGEEGVQPKADSVIYVTKEQADALSVVQSQLWADKGKTRVYMEIAPLGDGRWGVRATTGPDAGKFYRDSVVTPQAEPAVGLMPVEIWKKYKPHFGNAITEISGKPTPAPAPEGDGSRQAPVKVEIPEDVAIAGQRVAEPTPAQAEAENYRSGHLKLHGLDITIETPKGGVRRKVDRDTGKELWKVENFPAAYGRIKKTIGADGDAVDVFIGDDVASESVFVIDQVDSKTGRFDEHKSMLGFPDRETALAAYHAAFSDGKGPDRVGAVTEMPVQQFRAWARDGKKTAPLGDIESQTGSQSGTQPEKVARKRSRPQSPVTALSFIRNAGGIIPDADLRQIVDKARIPGLLNKNGMTPDNMLRALEEQQFILDKSGPNQTIDTSLQDLYDLVQRIVDGERVGQFGVPVETPMTRKQEEAVYREETLRYIETIASELGVTYDFTDAEQDRLFELVGNQYMSIEDALERVIMESYENEREGAGDREADADGRGDGEGAGTEGKTAEPGEVPGRAGQEAEARPQEPTAEVDQAPETGPFDSGPVPSWPDAKAALPTGTSVQVIADYWDNKGFPRGWSKLSDAQKRETVADLKKMYGGEAPAVTTEASGQTSLVPEATTGEKIKAADAKETKGKASDEDSGPLFNPDAGKQGDLVDLAKKPVKAEKDSWVVVDTDTNEVIYRFASANEARDWAKTHNADEFDGTGRRNRYMVQRGAVRDILDEKPAEPDRKPDTPKAETTETVAGKADGKAADKLRDQLISEGFKTIVEARKFMRDNGLVAQDATNKQIDEALEAAIVSTARLIVRERWGTSLDPQWVFRGLVSLYENQPNLASRTGTSVANQAYSTPVPLAYVAARLANTREATEVYEPSAGNGALLIDIVSPAKVYANEIDPDRAQALKKQGFTVTSNDGAEVPSLTDIDSVIMNPPFGAVKEGGKSKVFELGDLTTTKIDHAISLNALEAMADDGKAVLIIGGTKAEDVKERTASYRGLNMKDAKTGKGKDNFYRVLYDRYNVTDHFTVSGDLYTKQGASWPVDVIVIEGRGKSQRPLPGTPQGVPELLKTWDEIAEKIPNDTANDRAGDRPARKPVAPVERPAAVDEVRGDADVGTGADTGKPEARAKPASVRADAPVGQPEGDRGDAVGQGDVPAGGRGDRGRIDRDRAPRRERVKVTEGASQAKYEPVSGSKSVDTLVPSSMADSSRNAMERVEQRHGNVDDFVQDALGYEADADGMFFLRKNPETGAMEKQRPFSAEQIDAIASAIDNVERGDAMILGDACVAGHTRIYDPVSGTHNAIEDLAAVGKPIKVLALTPTGFQTVSATTPFYKGEADLYRVELDDGREITVTRQHRFLTPDGWQTLDDGLREGCFLVSAEGRLLKNLGGLPSIHLEGDRRCSRTPQDCQGGCSAYPCLCGELPPSGRDSALASLPSPADVLARTHYCLRADEMVLSLGHSRQNQGNGHLSRSSSSPTENRGLSQIASQAGASLASWSPTTLGNEQPTHHAQVELRQEGGAVLLDRSPADAFGSSPNANECAHRSIAGDGLPFEGSVDTSRRSVARSVPTRSQRASIQSARSFGDHTGWRCVKSITFVGRRSFFDMWVPGFENYVAEGIVNHNTGIGKGRVGAGMLRYAIKKGLVPVLMTEKMDLYGDMYRDMRDIGLFEMLGREPRILTTDVGKSIPLDEEAVEWKADAELAEEAGEPLPKRRGKFLSGGSAPAKDKAYDRLMAGDTDVADVVFTTYSQMQTLGEGKAIPRRRSVLKAIAPRAMMVLDETHNAGGQGVVDDTRGKKAAEGGRAEFVRELAQTTKGLLFMSATYAKRPNVMDLYARTDMGKAVEDIKDLPKLIQRGGVPMQQIVASMLAESGQYLRRERSFEGIEYAVEEAKVDDAAYDKFVGSVQSIFQFDTKVEEARSEIVEEILAELGAGTKGNDSGVGEASARSTSFSSIMHNIVSQMLLAIKADAAADRAIAALKAGEKPVITLANTNESFISDFAEADGTSIGGALDIDFGDMLRRYLQRTLRVTYKKAGDKKPSHYQIPIERLPASLQKAYRDVEALIDAGNYAGMPVAPIDWIRHRITKAGYSVREVTGRKTMLDYGRKTPTLVARPKGETGSAGKRVTLAKFNGGTLDAVILNQSGSTGVSIHANRTFKDQRKRRMILAQAEANIDTHMQMLGRINRTGQVILPAYSQLAAGIPAEVRPTAVLMKKMASLNANTTGARGSTFTAEAADFMNEVGDKVMAEYLWENPEINVALGEPYDGVEVKDVVQKATGKLVLLTVAQQREMLDTVQKNYAREIEQLDALGENPLEAKMLDLQAETLETVELKAKTGDSPFMEAVRIEKVTAKAQGRAMPISDIADKVAEALKITKPEGSEQAVIEQLEARGRGWRETESRRIQEVARKQMADELAETKAESREGVRSKALANISRWQQTMNVAYPGARVSLSMPSGDLDGIVMSVERSGKAKNIVALSAWTVKIAVPDSARQFEFPMSKLFPAGIAKSEDEKGATITRSSTFPSMLIQAFEEARKDGRETRYILTGNVLGGYDQTGGSGQIVNFTTKDGQVRPGVLMSRDFKVDKFMSTRAIRFRTADQVATFIDRVSDVEVTGRDAELVLGRNRNGYYIQMAKARGKAGKYYTDKAVRSAVAPTEFTARGNKMMAEDLSRDKFVAAVDEMRKIGAAFETNTAQDEAQAIVSGGVDRAIAATGRPDQRAIENIARFLKMGRTVSVPKDVVEGSLAEMRESLDLVPSGTAAGAVSKIAPAKKGALYDAVATIVDTDGKEHSLPINWATLAETRAFTRTDGSLIGLFRLSSLTGGNRSSAGEGAGRTGIGVQTAESRGLIAHEAIHARRRRDILRGSLWSTLVGHAGNLRILDKEYGTYLAEIGHPDANKYPGGVTIRELYEDIYRNEPDLQERMDQESVAIMVELIEHGALMPMEVAPIEGELKRVFRSAELGRSGRGRTDGGALFALDAYTGQSMRRSLDSLGFYSKALEAAEGLKQARGTPEQMLAQLKKAGVKDAEIEATGLRAAIDGKKAVTKSEIVSHLEGNRVGLGEVVRADQISPSERLSLRRRMDDLTARIVQAEGSRFTRQSTIDRMREERDRIRGKLTETFPDKTRFSGYSLDPSNPTYRETVLHLPVTDADLSDAIRAGHVDPDEVARFGDKPMTDFYSGHFPEPNIVGHMMTSLVRHEGKPVFLVDQIQSDWGQKLRDGGVRDEAKIADLRSRIAAIDAQIMLPGLNGDILQAALREARFFKTIDRLRTRVKVMSEGPDKQRLAASLSVMERLPENAIELFDNRELLNAELRTAEAATPGNPLVNTTDQWVNITLRRAIRQAAEADADYIAIPHGDTVLSYNPGDAAGMRGFYGSRTSEGIVPKNARKLLERMDGSIKPTRIEKLETTRGAEGWKGEHKERNTGRRLVDDRQMHDESRIDKSQTGFTLFPLTDAVKAMVKTEGQPLFSAVPPALGNLDRSTQRNIEQALRDATEIVGRIAGPGATVDARAQIPIWSLDLGTDQLQRSREVMGAAPETAGGFYRQMGDGKALIGLAFADPSHDLRTSAGHEAYHHVEAVLASPQEMKLLRSPSEMERATRHAAAEIGYSIEDARKLQDHEIRAIAFQRYRRMREEGMTMLPLHIGIRRMWDAMVRLLQNVRNALRGQGFDSMEAIFERARTGEMVAAAAERRIAATATPAPRVGLQRQMVPTGYVDREPFDLDKVREVRIVRDAGFDSLRVSNSHLMVFDPANIRSVNADFDPSQSASPQIMASIFPTATSSGTFFGRRVSAIMRRMAPRSDQWRVRLQDKFLMVRRQQEEIERQTGAELPLGLDVYTAESLFHGRAGERMADLMQKRVEPLVEHLRKNDIDADEFGDYLYARHAQERNAYIRSIDPANDAGSGMTDADAQVALARVASGTKAQAFTDAAAMIDQINKETRDTLLSSGLITRETYESWSTDYQHYVPLRGWEANEEEQVFPRVGKGFNIRGPEAYKALGRRTKSDNPVAYVLLQAQQAIVRSEKNRVNKTLLRLVESHPDPDVWQVYRGENRRVLKTDPVTGQDYVDTVFVPPQFSAHDPSIVGVKVGGKQHYIQIHNPNLARALRGVGSSDLDHAIVRNMMAVTRFYAQLLTSWNPEFVVGNFFRDVQTALINSKDVADLPDGTRKKMLAEALSLKSIRGIYNALRGDGSTEHAQYFEEFRLAGGKISFMDYNDVERIKARIEHLIGDGSWSKVMRAVRPLGKYVEDLNTSVENGVRLSTFIAMRKAGISRERAASVARELTVNFNRKGEWGPVINAAYMFFNASVQGSTRMLQAIAKSKAVRRTVYAIAFGGMAMEMLNYLISGDDDDKENAYDKIKPWIKERNMIFMLPGRKDYLMIPMPYGYNVPFVAGQKVGELIRSTMGHGKLTPAKAAAGIMEAMMGSFNPLGTNPTTSFLQMMSPTILDPVVQVAENKTWFGGPIFPTKFDKNKPDSETYFSSVHPAFIEAARWLNRQTGGNAAKSGFVDVSPEVLEHYTQFLGGGIAKFLLNATGTGQRALSGEEFIPEKTPILRRLYGAQTSASRRSDFYEAWTKVDAARYEVIQLNKAGDREGMASARSENKAELEAYGAMKSTQKALSQYSKQRTQIQLNRSLTDAEKKTALDEIKDKENKLILRALEVYNRAKKDAGGK